MADAKLFVSTDEGVIHCFSPQHNTGVREGRPVPIADPFPKDSLSSLYSQAAKRIVDQTGITKGYCLVLGAGQAPDLWAVRGSPSRRCLGDVRIVTDAGRLVQVRRPGDRRGVRTGVQRC